MKLNFIPDKAIHDNSNAYIDRQTLELKIYFTLIQKSPFFSLTVILMAKVMETKVVGNKILYKKKLSLTFLMLYAI